jgi:hypothetical protein
VALPYKEGLPLREWDLVFDVQHQPIGTEISIVFSVDFWNSFQRPDQWWGGFRILHSTEKAIYTVVFPDEKKPKADSVQYRFVRSVSQKPESLVIKPMDLKIRSGKGLMERVTWTVANPQPDRSYRVYWAW